MRAVITGVTGLAGSYLARYLCQPAQGDDVFGLARCQAKADRLTGDLPNDRRLSGYGLWDLAESIPPAVADAVRQFAPHVIYHLAALSHPSQCGGLEPTAAAMEVNMHGTRRVVELAATIDSPPRVVVVSTGRVYGPAKGPDVAVTEEFPTEPASGYATSKLSGELAAAEAARRKSVEIVIARPTNHTGPGQPAGYMIPDWAAQVADPSCERLEVFTLDAHVDMLDVRDVVRAYRLLAVAGEVGEIYNIGSGQTLASRTILKRLLAVAGRDMPVVELQPGQSAAPPLSSAKLHAQTGWSPEFRLEDTLGDVLDYYRDGDAWPPGLSKN